MNNELAFKDNTEKQTVSVDVTATVKNTMTVKEIAQAMGVSTDTVKNCIRRIMPEKMQNGKTTFLNEQEVTMISKELKSNTFVSSHQTYEVSSQVKNTTTRLEVLANYKAATQAMIELLEAEKAELQAENERQAQQLTLQAPKVEMYNALVDRTFCKNLRDTAHFVGEKERHFLAVLQEKSIIYKKGSSYRAYAKYADCFELKTFTYGENKTGQQLLVNVKGLELVKQIFGK